LPYDTGLEKKIDRAIEQKGLFDKRKMFGGVCYLLNGSMAFGVHKQSLIVRTTLEQAKELLRNGTASVFDITGKPMKGWLLISSTRLEDARELEKWLDLSIGFVKTLPEK
jgi:TfoX/Sxy family transcriptional regulator of competence genes